MKKGRLFIVSGPSGVGKDTIILEAIKKCNNLWLSISETTREKRTGEEEGVNYYFISRDEFEQKIKNDMYLEYAIVHSNEYYGTPKDKVLEKLNNGINVILEIDVQGAFKIKEKFNDAFLIFILPPSIDELETRLRNRNTESEEKIIERLETARKEILVSIDYDIRIVNDNLDNAIDKFISIINDNC